MPRLIVIALLFCATLISNGYPAVKAESDVVIVDTVGSLNVVQQQATLNCGLMNSEGSIIIPLGDCDLELHPLSQGVTIVGRFDSVGATRYALCADSGMITNFDYSYLEASTESNMPILAVTPDYQCGFIDMNGDWVIQPRWEDAEPFSEGVAYVRTESQHGYINAAGAYIITVKANEWLAAGDFSEGRAWIQSSNGLCGYIDITGNLVVPCIYVETFDYSNGLARVKDDKGNLFIDLDGKPLTDNHWKRASDYAYGYAIVSDAQNQYGIINTNGQLVYPLNAHHILDIASPHSVWIALDDSGYYGLFQFETKEFCTPIEWEIAFDDEGFPYRNEYYIVKKNGRYNLISENGELLLPTSYDIIFYPEQGDAVAVQDGCKYPITLPN